MKLENWNTNIAKVRAWMAELDDEKTKIAIEALIGLGEMGADDDARSGYWTSIRSVGSQCEGFPKARVGQPSLLSATGQINVATVVSQVTSAFASIGENHDTDMLLKVVLPHGRTGGEYSSWEAFSEHMGEVAERNMLSAVKEERWEAENDIMTCQAPLTKAERDALAEEGGDAQE